MVSFSQSCHYFSFNKLPTPVAAGTIHALVIQGAKVFPVLNEKASLCQVTATHWKKKKQHILENTSTKDVRNSLCCQQMRLPRWPYFFILDSCLHLLSLHGLDKTGDDWHSLATRDLVIKNLFGETYTVTTSMHSGLTKTSVILYYPVNHASSCMEKLNLRFDFMLLNIRYDIVPDSSSQLSGFMFSSQ